MASSATDEPTSIAGLVAAAARLGRQLREPLQPLWRIVEPGQNLQRAAVGLPVAADAEPFASLKTALKIAMEAEAAAVSAARSRRPAAGVSNAPAPGSPARTASTRSLPAAAPSQAALPAPASQIGALAGQIAGQLIGAPSSTRPSAGDARAGRSAAPASFDVGDMLARATAIAEGVLSSTASAVSERRRQLRRALRAAGSDHAASAPS